MHRTLEEEVLECGLEEVVITVLKEDGGFVSVEMAGVMVGVVFESVQAVFMVKWWRTIQWVVWMMGL